jgi:hypothetical protein
MRDTRSRTLEGCNPLDFIDGLLQEIGAVKLEKQFQPDEWMKKGMKAFKALEAKLDAYKLAKDFYVLDSPYWFCIVFERQEQKEAFLEKAWPQIAKEQDKYIDGPRLAAHLGITLPKAVVRREIYTEEDKEILHFASDKLDLPKNLMAEIASRKAEAAAKAAAEKAAKVVPEARPKRTTVFQAAKKRQEFFDIVLDWDYWCCVCFASEEQKAAFLEAVWPGVELLDGKFIDGMLWAKRLGIELPVMKMPASTVKPHPELAELAMTLEEARELAEKRRVRVEQERRAPKRRERNADPLDKENLLRIVGNL